MTTPLFRRLCLDSGLQTGLASECSPIVSMPAGSQTAQLSIVMYSQSATNVSIQLQVSFDGENFADSGTAQTVAAVGNTILTSDTSISAAFIRHQFSITGTGKAILGADLMLSDQ